MKEFLKYVLATVIGILTFAIVIGIISVISIMGMVASQEATTVVKEKSVLVLPLSGIVTEAGLFSPDSPASCQALRNALVDFKKSGKWIVAYGDQYTQSSYYVASVADEVLLNPYGTVDWHGLSAQPMFYKDLLAKVGVKMQIVKVGKFKSATEVFTEDQMSDANRLQTSKYLTGIWNSIVGDVAASRKIPVAKLNEYADSLVTFDDPKSLVEKKLVDKLLYTDEVKKNIKKRLGLDDDEVVNQMSVIDMVNLPAVKNNSDNKIAVYYAYGDVVDSEMGQTGNVICGPTVSKDLEELMNDDDVKAVVLRVNSPGGSAYASEQIWNAVRKLKAKKPVVVSMGGYAASGGYYISCAANYIVAEPTSNIYKAQGHEIPQGRVCLRQDAKKIKLVDALGGIDVAVTKAAELAKLGTDYKTKSYPAAPDFLDQLLSSFGSNGGNYLDEQLKATLGEYYEPVKLIKNVKGQHPLQTRMPYYLVIK